MGGDDRGASAGVALAPGACWLCSTLPPHPPSISITSPVWVGIGAGACARSFLSFSLWAATLLPEIVLNPSLLFLSVISQLPLFQSHPKVR